MQSKRVSLWGLHRKKGLGLFGGKTSKYTKFIFRRGYSGSIYRATILPILLSDGAIPGLYIERNNANIAYSMSFI